jgi:hypothetical protein
LNQTETERLIDLGETSERVAFTCPGCGRDTVIHVGLRTMLPEKRCLRCQGTDRVGRMVKPMVKGQRTGTHGGRRIADPELRARQRAKTLRASKTRMGEPMRKPCAQYDECSNHKHRKASRPHPAQTGRGKFR